VANRQATDDVSNKLPDVPSEMVDYAEKIIGRRTSDFDPRGAQ
jgi:hypothetical protein